MPLVKFFSGNWNYDCFTNKHMENETQRLNTELRNIVNEVLDHELRDKFLNEFIRNWKIGNDLYSIEVYPKDIPGVQPYVEKFKNQNS